MKTKELYKTFEKQITDIEKQMEKFYLLDLEQLNWRQVTEAWSILECMEHLNLYGDYYLPTIQSAINSSSRSANEAYKSGWLGNYFANSMLPKEKLNKMKTFKDKNPLNSKLDQNTIDRFQAQLAQLKQLIEQSKKVNLSRVRIPTSISPLLKLKLGDTFRFYINHILRHIAQMDRSLIANDSYEELKQKVS